MAKVTDIDFPPRASRKVPARRRARTAVAKPSPEKVKLAYELRIAGKSHYEIAEELGMSSDAVSRMLEEQYALDAAYLTETERMQILGLEMVRLDRLLAAVWPSAMMGDPKSVDTALKVVQTRLRAAHLDQTDPVINKNMVLVMGEKEDEYISALKAIQDD